MSRRTFSVAGFADASSRNNNFATPDAEIYINDGARRAPNTSVTRQGKNMNQQFGEQAFEQAEKLFKNARIPENVRAIAHQSVAATQEIYTKTVTAAHDNAKALTEIADTVWGSTKMLNEKFAQNMTANFEAAFTVAHSMAGAKSLPEIAKIQSEYLQKIAAQATEQTKAYYDLSTRATQHVFEKIQDATMKSFKPTF
jgi:hypothetical protein